MKRAEAQAVLGELAAGQFGLVTSAQAREYGVDAVTVHRLQAAGLLQQVGHGVYQVAGAVTPTHLEIRVAWLRLNPQRPAWERDGRGERDGVVSHASACLLHELGDIPAPKVELTVTGKLQARDRWVRLRRHSQPLPEQDVTLVDGLPATTVERTILDLIKDGVDAGHLGGVIAEAERRGALDLPALAERAARFASRYSMPKATGMEVLTGLAAAAGQRLQSEQASELLGETAAAAYTAGQVDAFSALLEQRLREEGWQGGEALSQLLAPLRNALAHPVGGETSNLAAALETLLEPTRSVAERLDPAQLIPVFLTLQRHTESIAPYTAASTSSLASALLKFADAVRTASIAHPAASPRALEPNRSARPEIDPADLAEDDTDETEG
ncbi:type IV toxin-antitoxin system AbiEi family antitoxin domain-containing protein [Actinospica sp. MGRD01-02]|uniref:Type IV toxin-antitoxin system AbiEi family antitoxin domain-containing protein n=1 Tax=Actinospica acidithermotolerans TaxID=2828514 RepID=A0A941IM35_9ACTN|nr:type IV toxin-antitoxin system AbiEi family antitoxin domain-containing protein [Actinospica acidithermotolerans]MBR7830652.1 type IV toxin-antitoxin system AbiEi family antitoxin domain-containing protein [Actinospica acidithermotolerans]